MLNAIQSILTAFPFVFPMFHDFLGGLMQPVLVSRKSNHFDGGKPRATAYQMFGRKLKNRDSGGSLEEAAGAVFKLAPVLGLASDQ
jgi:hypothetical protein